MAWGAVLKTARGTACRTAGETACKATPLANPPTVLLADSGTATPAAPSITAQAMTGAASPTAGEMVTRPNLDSS
jgi:hypothetical protein